MSQQDTTITFRISKEEKQKAKQVAAFLNIPLSRYIKKILSEKVRQDAASIFYTTVQEQLEEEENNGNI